MIKGDRILNVGTPAGGGVSIIANDPVASGGGGGDNPPITDNMILYVTPEQAYSDSAGTTLAVNGDNIPLVKDLSSSANDLTQLTASSQPSLDTTKFPNGAKAIFALSDYLSFTNTINFPQTDDYFTIYIVLQKYTAGIHYSAISNNSQQGRTEFQTDSMDLLSYVGSRRDVSYLSADNGTDLRLYTFTLDRTAGTIGELKGYLNSVYQGMETSSQINTNYILEFTRTMHGNGWYGDILMYQSAHDATEVAQVSDWLNDKYSIY